jgi:hypothetical protein
MVFLSADQPLFDHSPDIGNTERTSPLPNRCVREIQKVGTNPQTPLHRGRPVTPPARIAPPPIVLWSMYLKYRSQKG